MVLPGKGQSNFILNFNLSAFALNLSASNRMMLSILEAQHRTLPFSIKFLNFVFDGSRLMNTLYVSIASRNPGITKKEINEAKSYDKK